MKHIYSIIVLLLVATSAFAQQELGTHFINGSWQATYSNPALMPKNKVVVALPGFYNNLHISNITLHDLLPQNINGQSIIQMDEVIDKLGDQNLLQSNFSIEGIGVGLRFNKLALYFNNKVNIDARIDYPKTLAQLLFQGNAQFIGQNVDIGTDIQLTSWHEIALGAAYQVTDNITVGAKGKLLSGIANFNTEKKQLQLQTSDDIYQLELKTDYVVNSTTAIDFTDMGANNIDIPTDIFSSNTGAAFDLGVNIDLDKLHIAASAIDIGKISWDEGVHNYTLSGTTNYEGVDISDNILNDGTEIPSFIDSLEAVYTPIETTNAYSTALTSKYYLSGTYELTDNLLLGSLFYFENHINDSAFAWAVSGQYKLSDLLQVGANYSIRNNTYANIGLNSTVKLGPVQLVLATDNIITIFSRLKSHSANARLGLNLVFGEVEDQKAAAPSFY